MSTKHKNRHGRIGVKRSAQVGPRRKSDTYTHAATIEENVQRIPIAHRNINEAFSRHTIGTFRTRRPERKERSWLSNISDKIHRNLSIAKKNNEVKFGKPVPTVTPESEALLRKSTVAQLKKICDDNGIEYKSKDTKAVLLRKLGINA